MSAAHVPPLDEDDDRQTPAVTGGAERGLPSSAAPTSAATIYPHTVYWEDDLNRSRKVIGRCVNCEQAALPTWPEGVAGVVSVNGIEHMADHGTTTCGHDATGPDWWWPT